MSEGRALRVLEALLKGKNSPTDQARLKATLPSLTSIHLPLLAERLASHPILVSELESVIWDGELRDQPSNALHRGALIAIEGIDGAGKGTQAELLVNRAHTESLRANKISFPRYGITVFSHIIADYLNGRFGTIDTVDPHFSALLFAGDRFESRKLLEQFLERNDVVVLDRYVSSNIAYHGARVPPLMAGVFADWLYRVEYDIFRLPTPNRNVFLDLPIAVAQERVLQKTPRTYTTEAADIHERRQDYMQRCHDVFVALSSNDRYGPWSAVSCINQSQIPKSVHEIAEVIWSLISYRIWEPR